MATKEENPSVAPRQQDVLRTNAQANQDSKVVREQKIALVQRVKDDEGKDTGEVRLSFEPDDHGARPGMVVLSGDQAKSIPEGDDRGYLVIRENGSQEWKSTADVEKK